ncbi:MAG: putative DNA-binding domain-containing protein [Candidatus Thiodiazotropha lotti]|nr:putative DNA-binding domain-containing protein [Candidatus Thiodiazotropha lotti]
MSLLAELQRSFCDGLRTADAPDGALLEMLQDDDLARQRFQVYRNNFIVLNGDALADMFPVVKRLVGDEAFRMLATAYVRQHPPRDRTLLLYGDLFGDFLQTIPELSELPYLSDVAGLEFAWTAAYHAADALPLQPDQLQNLSEEAFVKLQLRVHPSLQLLASDFPIHRIWSVNQSDDQDELISLDEGACRLIVVRPGNEVQVRVVSEGEFEFVKQLMASATIGEAFEATNQTDPQFDLGQFFSRHLFDGTFCAM